MHVHPLRGEILPPSPFPSPPCHPLTACAGNQADEGLIVPVQKHMAALLGPDAIVFSVYSGHFPFLSVPDKIVEAVALGAERGMERKAAALCSGGQS